MNATLFCNATGNPVPTIRWTKGGSVIMGNSKNELSADQKHLTVINVSRNDGGEYLCEAENSLGNNTSTGIRLDVQYRPEITFHPNAVIRPVGSSVILYCNVTANPEPTISWTKIGFSGQLHNNSRISYSESHKKLTMANVNMRDSGKYECAATNDVGKDVSRAALVDVTCNYDVSP
ncbi:Neural cell adhesion molecule 1 [Stylophora pistillata]|uniref:Neural cell adhesion molecule 1 n=1 Tax=Stylophora pistillata TaxID=50429 RepID=A0A2B4RSL2_STYPI|nr:Neural cell adhesion molecule 1 [Stylophora pistillata]